MDADKAFAEDRETAFVKGEEIADFVGSAVLEDENCVISEVAVGEICVVGGDMGRGKGDNVTALGLP